MMAHEFELRLIGGDAPDGEISLSTLADLADSLRELNLRIGRGLLASTGPGRTAAAVGSLTDMRLVGLTAGSTRLQFARGRSDELALDIEAAAEIDARFWEVVAGVAANHRPEWVTDLIAVSAGKFVAALSASAPEVELTKNGAQTIRVTTATLRTDVWQSALDATTERDVLITGRLEAVDLRNGRFRVVDDVGNRLRLDRVPDPTTVAHLINHRVRAVGAGLLDPDGRLKGIDRPSVEAQVLPASWFDRGPADLSAELAKPGPALGGGVELTDEEFADFMESIKGQ